MATKKLGVDISYANGNVDFDALKKAGVKFVILRCGFGNDLTHQDDAQYFANLKKCKEHDMPYGVYLYSYAKDKDMANSEAKHTLRLLKDANPVYGVWYDVEDSTQKNADLISICQTYCDILKENGYYVGIYSFLAWFNNQLNSPKLDKYPKWVAQWNSECTYKKPYDIWQFADNYVIGGKKFDGNYAYKDFEGNTDTLPKKTNSKPAQKPPAKTPQKNSDTIYTVKSGDTLSGIASQLGTTYQKLAEINGIENPNLIYVGQKIKINGSTQKQKSNPAKTYTVKSGDTLSGIAAKYGTTSANLAAKNGIKNPDLIYPGQKIKI